MRIFIVALLVVLVLPACRPISRNIAEREAIESGVLQLGLRSPAFLKIWGRPDRTYVTSGDEVLRAGWGAHGGEFFKGKPALEVWEYRARDVVLVFEPRGRELVGWKTDKTVKELGSAPDK